MMPVVSAIPAHTRECDPRLGELYAAGERVPPGTYREVETGRLVILHGEEALPACLNGRAARYSRLSLVYAAAARAAYIESPSLHQQQAGSLHPVDPILAVPTEDDRNIHLAKEN